MSAGSIDSADSRVMQGGMGAIVDLARRRWHWRRTDAVALDQALQRGLAICQTATATQMQHAHRRVAQMTVPA